MIVSLRIRIPASCNAKVSSSFSVDMLLLLLTVLNCLTAHGVDPTHGVNPIIESEAHFHGETVSTAVSDLKRHKRAFYTADLQATVQGEFLPPGIQFQLAATISILASNIVGYGLAGIV